MRTAVAVGIIPGVIALTVMPSRPSSLASERGKPITPPFDVVYATIRGGPSQAAGPAPQAPARAGSENYRTP